ncbi:MAG: ABC transporter substrate-binding protein [Deltaproteobacteria bacterium]|nr:ABC transporter substrate-binding protein [Deltaproteobacteria bacterium]
MIRKIVVCLLTTALLPAGLIEAQQTKKVPRIGLLNPSSSTVASTRVDSFRQGLRELGYIEGKNVFIEARYAEAKQDRLPNLATELVQLKVDVIVTATTPGVLAAKKATSTIPIVFAGVGDPVRAGVISSLARPSGNITGLSILSPELEGKRLELLKEMFPKTTRVAYLWNPGAPGAGLTGMQAAAPALGLQLQSMEVRSPNDFDSAFEAVLKKRAEAITAAAHPIIDIHRKRIVDFAAKNRLPAIYTGSEYVDAGGLMFYGVSFPDLYRRAATYVDKILKGAKPADLPVEQPTKFELIINLKTAKQIGLTIPPNVLARANKVIK